MRDSRRPRSFRWRIALLSLLVSGATLLAFAIPAWILLGRINLQRIDHEVGLRVLPHLGRHVGSRHWVELENQLRYTYAAGGSRSVFLLVRGPEGRSVVQTDTWPDGLDPARFPLAGSRPGTQPPAPPRVDAGEPGRRRGRPPTQIRPPEVFTWREGMDSWRILHTGNEFATVVVGVSLAAHRGFMLKNALALVLALPLAALLAAAGGWLLSGRALRPVRELTETAETITAQGLDRRITPGHEDAEFARLISVFNAMLERLESSFQQATRFSADAAHELKTPLMVLQGELEQALQEAEDGSREQRVYSGLLEEVQRLKSIIRKLLLLSLADAGRLELTLKPLDLTAAVETLLEDSEVLAPDLKVSCEAERGVWVDADAELLGQVLHNLAANAIKYNRPGGRVHYRLQQRARLARLTVTNTGAGIPPEDAGRVFQRFYRASRARDRAADGVGLGLSLSREIARAHGGDLALSPGGRDATSFVLTLPLGNPPGDGGGQAG